MLADLLAFGLLGGVVAVLAVATGIGAILAARVRSAAGRETVANLNDRIRSWWIMIGCFGAVLALGPTAIICFFGALSFLALREYLSLAPTRQADHRTLFLCFFVIVPMQYWLVSIHWYGLFAVLIPVYAFVLLPALSAIAGDTRDFLARSARVQFGLLLTVYAMSNAPALLMLDDIAGYGESPAMLLIYLMIVVQISDVGQYVFGKLLGRTPLAPQVSTAKTVEGLILGGALAIAVGTALHRLTPFRPAIAAVMSLLIVVAGALGGLVLSAIKRDLRAKDWGRLIAGHGGVLDRMDSVCFAAPLFFQITRYYYT